MLSWSMLSAGGGVWRQSSTAKLQRSANAQPAGKSISSGTLPGIVVKRVPRAKPKRGRAVKRPRV
jgi:hypothetical protein